MAIWSRRAATGRRRLVGDGGRVTAGPDTGPRPSEAVPAADPCREAAAVIDLTDRVGWAARIQPDPVLAMELAERFRARAARAEAQRDLRRLRARHWSGERVVEEGRAEVDWWEHPEADPYAVLGLLPGARLDEAAAARRRIAQQCHPDRLGPDADVDEALRRMVAANAAFDRLRRALHPV